MAADNFAALPANHFIRQAVLSLLVMVVVAAYGLSPAGGQSFGSSIGPSIQDPSNDPNVALTRAREQANATQKRYETVKRLSEQGSVSQRVVRLSDLQRKVALLDYSSLLNPARREKNLLLKAEVILQFRSEELAVTTSLYQRGSVSKVDYLRSVAAYEIAESDFKAAKSANEAQRKIQAIKAATSKYEVALAELEIARRLFESQSISQSTLDRAVSNLKIAEAELEASKQSLGAKAVQVRQ